MFTVSCVEVGGRITPTMACYFGIVPVGEKHYLKFEQFNLIENDNVYAALADAADVLLRNLDMVSE